jgi:type I restriction enzyme S subunit
MKSKHNNSKLININTIMEKTNNITNKEALRDKIHDIHNYMRNNGIGYGMNALKTFNILYGLKKIDEKKLFDKTKLDEKCKFSNLLELANKSKDEKLTCIIINDLLVSLGKREIGRLLYYEIPQCIKSNVFAKLIKDINDITKIENSCKVQLSGKIYEYFIGRDESAISELGAYFTDRHIVNYIYDKLKPKLNEDGTVPTMIDMFGGSGGFTIGYINYLIKNSKTIDWNKELSKVYHFDMNEDVVKSAGLELFCLTGIIPDMKDNLSYRNSFTDEFEDKKFHFVITNPPYGGDKNVKSDKIIKLNKIKDYINSEIKNTKDEVLKKQREEQLKKILKEEKIEKKENEKRKVSTKNASQRITLFSKKYGLVGNDKESTSLILMMDLVEENGTVIGVLKEGVFFNKTYKDLRKCLLENFNVREIISVQPDQFENTTTKTSIVVFDNTKEKTKKVKFYNLVVERYEEDKFIEFNNEIFLEENKGDIKNVKDSKIYVATLEEIMKNPNYSLNGNDYVKREINVGKDYELVKLGDVCEIKYGERIVKKDIITGDYNVYGGGNTSYTSNKFNREGKTCKIGRFGTSEGNIIILLNEKYFLNDSGFTIKSIDENKIRSEYLWFFMVNNKNIIYDCTRGSIQKNVDMDKFKKIEIPIPKTKEKITEWVTKISKPYDEKNNKQNKIKELEKLVQEKIKNIIDNEECEEVKLGDVCEIKYGERIVKKNIKSGNYNVYGGGNTNYTINKFNREGKTCKIGRFGTSEDTIVILLNEKYFLNDSGFTIKSIDENKIKSEYLWFFMVNNKNMIYNCTRGSIQKNVDIDKFKRTEIPIPKNKQLIKDLESTFNEIEKLQLEVKKSEELYNKYINELKEEAMPPKKKENKEIDIETKKIKKRAK